MSLLRGLQGPWGGGTGCGKGDVRYRTSAVGVKGGDTYCT